MDGVEQLSRYGARLPLSSFNHQNPLLDSDDEEGTQFHDSNNGEGSARVVQRQSYLRTFEGENPRSDLYPNFQRIMGDATDLLQLGRDLTATQRKSSYFGLGVILGLGALFTSKNTSIQRIGTVLAMISLAKIHFDVSKETEKVEGIIKSMKQHFVFGEDLTVKQKWNAFVRSIKIEARENPKKVGEKVVQIGSYLVGAALLLRSPTALKVMFLISSGIYIKSIFTQYSSLKADVQKEIPGSYGRNFDQYVQFNVLSGENPFVENTQMFMAWNCLAPVVGSYNQDEIIAGYEQAHQACPTSMVILEKLGRFYLERNVDDDLGKAEECLVKMKGIDASSAFILQLSFEIQRLMERNQQDDSKFGQSSQHDALYGSSQSHNMNPNSFSFSSHLQTFHNPEDVDRCGNSGSGFAYEEDYQYDGSGSNDPLARGSDMPLHFLDDLDNGSDVDQHISDGNYHVGQCNYKEALESFSKYEKMNPDHTNSKVAFQLGYIYMHQNNPNYTLAREYFAKAEVFGFDDQGRIQAQLDRIVDL